MNKAKINYWVDAALALSYIITAVTGLIIFFFLPGGVKQGRLQEFMGIIKENWTSVHNWVGIAMIVLSLVHLMLHWNWIVCMTKNIFSKGKKEKNCDV